MNVAIYKAWCNACKKLTDHFNGTCIDTKHNHYYTTYSSSCYTKEPACMKCSSFYDKVYNDYKYCPYCGTSL